MTLDDLKARAAFVVALNDQEKAFVLAVCSNGGDKREAVKTAYNCTTEQSITTTVSRLSKRPIIKGLIDEYFEITDEIPAKEALQALLWKQAQAMSPTDKAWLPTVNLLCEISGFKQERAPAPTPEGGDEDWVSRLEKVKA